VYNFFSSLLLHYESYLVPSQFYQCSM